MAGLKIEVRNLMLFVEGSNHTSHVFFPVGGHQLVVTGIFDNAGLSGTREVTIDRGADLWISPEGSADPFNGGQRSWQDPNDYVPIASTMYRELGLGDGRAAGPASSGPIAGGPPRLTLIGGRFMPKSCERYPELGATFWQFNANGRTYRHRITDAVDVDFDVAPGAYRVVTRTNQETRELRFAVTPEGARLTFINRDDCDPPAFQPVMHLKEYAELYRAAGLPPGPIPAADSPEGFDPNRHLRTTRRAQMEESCDSVCGSLRVAL